MIKYRMPQDSIDYIPGFFTPQESEAYFERLLKEIPWEQKQIKIFGKWVTEPRLTAWMGDADAVYTYSGTRMQPLNWTPSLLKIKKAVEMYVQQPFNSVLANLYRDHRDSMGMHRDNEKELGFEPFIASLSLGATRRFVMKPLGSKITSQKEYRLTAGSLLIMRGKTQELWKHGVPKETKPCEARINLTFRKILNSGL